MLEVSESDWKVLRRLHQAALERFCEQVLHELEQLSTASPVSPHQRYLKAHELMRQSDDELASVFDDLRRSRAIQIVAMLKSRELITQDEFAAFSEELRGVVGSLLG